MTIPVSPLHPLSERELELAARSTVMKIVSASDTDERDKLWRILLDIHTEQAIREMQASPRP